MTTTRHRPTWDLALDPLVSCKLCLGEYPLEQMTTVAQCQCVFCTLVGPCWRRHRVKGCRRVSLRLRFASPDRKPRPVPLPRVKGAPPSPPPRCPCGLSSGPGRPRGAALQVLGRGGGAAAGSGTGSGSARGSRRAGRARLPSGKRRLAPRCGPTGARLGACAAQRQASSPGRGAGRECVRAPRGHVQMPPGGASPTWGQGIAVNAGGGQGALLPAGRPPPQTRRRARRRGGQSTGLRSVSFDFPCFSSRSRHPNKQRSRKGKEKDRFLVFFKL